MTMYLSNYRHPRQFGVVLVLATLFVLAGCRTTATTSERINQAGVTTALQDRSIEWVFLQINDVYEIVPSTSVQPGGLERVATLRKQLMRDGNRVVTVMGGDFLSPSAAGNAKVDGERLAGKQMVAMLNALGVEYAALGNHEFDIAEEAFRKRLSEAEFTWVGGNVTDAAGRAFDEITRTATLRLGNQFGDSISVGILSSMLTSNQASYVRYSNPIASIRSDVLKMSNTHDVLVGLTHMEAEQDALVAEQSSELSLIMGGHEHSNMLLFRGEGMTPIAKADANARSAYVHYMHFDPVTRKTSVRSEFVPMTIDVVRDRELLAIGDQWLEIAFSGFRENGFDPAKTVAVTTDQMDGLESSVRFRPTRLTRLIAEAMREDAGAGIGLFNSGSIRIDDYIPAGPLSQYDVIRILPFPGKTLHVEMTGALLARALTESSNMKGAGGFLQTTDNVAESPTGWFVDGAPIDLGKTYSVAISDYLAGGNENGLTFIDHTKPGSGITLLETRRDLRLAVIDKLTRTYK